MGCIKTSEATVWANEMGIQLSLIPLKYLALPLCSSTVNARDYLPLLESH